MTDALPTLLRVLQVEDSEDDALLILRALRQAGSEVVAKRVDTRAALQEALTEGEWDVVLSDYYMPAFSGMEALSCLRETGRDIPFILISGKIGEELAVQVMKAGAQDFVAKDNLVRLAPVVERELRDAEQRRGRLIAERSLVEQLERFGRAMRQTVQALATALEMRDPYTAGHQQRVAKLSVAICGQLAMPADETTGVELAALIHDVGKVYVPAEILSRPGGLTSSEFEIIKPHPRIGYEIVKDVEFPWAVAEMIFCHHERLDGSGYPRGLRRDDIPPGAKIIAVADVVEAMSSYRPYRPAIGLDSALAEIRAGRGVLYDERVVDACLHLFQSGNFSFQPSASVPRPS